MTPSRIAAVTALCLGVLALVFVALGGGKTHKYVLVFDDAGGLIKGNLLKVSGQSAGTVTDIAVTKDLKARVEIELEELGPLRKGTTAQIRATSLGGVANKYIALSLAPNNAPELDDGAAITDTRGITGQDELVNAFDTPTREGLQKLVRGSAAIFEDNADNVRTATENAPKAFKELQRFADGLDPNDGALRDVLVNLAAVNSALAERAPAITSLTRQSGIAARAAAADGNELSEAIARAPKAIDEANQVLTKLPGTLDAFETLIKETDANDAGLPAALNQLSDTLDSGESTIGELATALNKKGPNNDAADLLKASVSLGNAAEDASKTVPGALKASQPLFAKTRAYTPDVISALTGLGQLSANYDGLGHYLRLSPVLNVFELAGTSGGATDLIPRSSFLNRLQGFQATGNRCPGSATQAPSDGSAPFTDNGSIFCDPSSVPPGP